MKYIKEVGDIRVIYEAETPEQVAELAKAVQGVTPVTVKLAETLMKITAEDIDYIQKTLSERATRAGAHGGISCWQGIVD